MAINITDYKRTGIFIEEKVTPLDLLNAPLAPNVHFVPGFSKTGTIFNKPVLLTSGDQRKNYFGKIDRNLEKKGSFFHRTIDIALQTAPVYAMNLLRTTEDDTTDYVSLSLAAQYDNGEIQPRRYDDFFNKAGFWNRSTDSFMHFAEDSTKKIHFANLSSSKMTFFVFKEDNPAFDVTAEVWYANREEEVPTWMSPKALISDYLIRVIAVKGDYTKYTQLSIDSIFSKYFTTQGLRKDKIQNFLMENGVITIGDYSGSIIPYFQDMNGNNMFIESLINVNTDRTGFFCAVDTDSIESDFPNGVVDLIGETLVDNEKAKINYLSYNGGIQDHDEYGEVDSDGKFELLILDGFDIEIDTPPAPATPTLKSDISNNPVALFNGQMIDVVNGVDFVSDEYIPTGTANYYRKDVIYVGNDGIINIGKGQESSTNNATLPTNYPNDAYILGYVDIKFDGSGNVDTIDLYDIRDINIISSFNFIKYDINDLEYPDTTPYLNPPVEINTTAGNDELIFNISSLNKDDYKSMFAEKVFNELANNMSISTSYIETTAEKQYLNDAGVSMVIDDNYLPTSEKRITFTYDTSLTSTAYFYTDKNQKVITTSTVEGFTSNTKDPQYVNYVNIGRQSQLYMDFIDGHINSGDYFYESYGELNYQFINYTDMSFPDLIGRYIIIDNNNVILNGGENIIIDDFSHNKVVTLGNKNARTDGTALTPAERTELDNFIDPALQVNSDIYAIDNNIATTDVLTSMVHNVDAKVYLKMYSIGKDAYIKFCADNTLSTAYGPLNIHEVGEPTHIYSGNENYTQTLEIIQDPNYEMTDTKFLIDMSRYNEISKGDFVKAYVDWDEIEDDYGTQIAAAVEPKRFARIIRKAAWSGNVQHGTNYAEITTDVKYDVMTVAGGTQLQTTTYKAMEKYVSTYKGFKLNQFRPTNPYDDLTANVDDIQNSIMDIVAKETNLYYAITNKMKFNFRYLIDSFGNGLHEFSKQRWMDLVGKRKNAIAFLNTPSAKQLIQSNNPSFTNDDGTLNMEYFKDGGDHSKAPSFLYSFAQGSGKDDGRDCSAYTFPYVTVNDGGRPLNFPPSAFVANTYMRKNSSNIEGIYNFTVAAGVNNGLMVGFAGTEMDFNEKDYEYAKTMGLNLISYNPDYGYYLETEFTAMQQPKTPISNLHVRELLIDMENEMFAMLFKYQYQFNIPSVRDKIKREADDICQKFMNRGGITYYKNQIDEVNNTPQLIDNQFGLLETTIVPVAALSTLVNIFHITTNQALAGSTGFQ